MYEQRSLKWGKKTATASRSWHLGKTDRTSKDAQEFMWEGGGMRNLPGRGVTNAKHRQQKLSSKIFFKRRKHTSIPISRQGLPI